MSKRSHDDLDERQIRNEDSRSPVSLSPDAAKKRLGLDERQHLGRHQQISISQPLKSHVFKSELESQLNCSDNEVSVDRREELEDRADTPIDPSNSPHLDVGTPASNSSGKHLVKHLSDLPQFVTIEGFRVASYLIDDETYLCLPNLLQFIQQKYPLEEVVKVFENTVTNFKSATPKQVEGFIKAIALPEGAKTCPLIRKLDADRVLEALAENHSDDEINEITNDGAIDSKEKQTDRVTHSQLTISSPVDDQSGRPRNSSHVHDVLGSKPSASEANHIGSAGCSKKSLQRHTSTIREIKPTSHRDDASRTQQNHASSSQPYGKITQGSGGVTSQVFNTNDDGAILNLARASTSMLRIKVYHRCFGKCDGLYYPSRIRNSDSKCIECITCHLLLSPKKFIRHTHGPREENVCHWGFVSSNWRHYISLKRNQDTNDLDDEELMVQLNSLRTAPDRETNNGEQSKLVSQIIHNHSNQTKTIQDKARHKLMSSTPILSSSAVVIPSLGPGHVPTTYPSSLNRKQTAIQSNNPIGIVRPTILDSVTSDGMQMSSLLESLARKPSAGPQQGPSGLPYLGATNAMSRVRSQNPLDQHTLDASICPYRPHHPLNGLLTNPLLFPHHFDQSTSSHVNPYEIVRSASRSAANTNRLSHIEERLIKQDIFVSSSLASYLSSCNLGSDLVKDIIEQTLDAIHKSRVMY